MNKEKEIEDLRQVIAEYSCNRRCTEDCDRRGYCCIKRFVTNIIDAGYGNVKQAVKEFADWVCELIFSNSRIATATCVSYVKAKPEYFQYKIKQKIKELYGEGEG